MTHLPPPPLNDCLAIAPEIVLTVLGLLVLILDFTFLRRAADARRRLVLGGFTLLGVLVALGAAWAAYSAPETGSDTDPTIFYGTIAGDQATQILNLLVLLLLGLVAGLSMAWTFTERWGEYYALLVWAAVGMMFLIAAEELLILFLSLETMTICLYLITAFETSRQRSAEGGLKYFVYGSVSSALFLFGLSLIYGLTGSTRLVAIDAVLRQVPVGLPINPNQPIGLAGNVAGATALLLILVGFGFKVAAVPFHQWAPDAYEGAPAPVTAWVASGSKVASFIALMKVLLMGLGTWASLPDRPMAPGWVGVLAILSAASMTYGNFAALAQRNLKRMLAYSSVAHAGYILLGVLAAAVSIAHQEAAGAVLFYLVVYSFTTVGAFAVAAWLVKDRGGDEIDDLNGLGAESPLLAVCIVLLMLSLIGVPPLGGFFGKLYMFMEAINVGGHARLTLMWLVGLGLLNSVISAFYYVRVLKALFLRPADRPHAPHAPRAVSIPIVLATAITLLFGIYPTPVLNTLKGAAIPMLESSVVVTAGRTPGAPIPKSARQQPQKEPFRYSPEQQKMMGTKYGGGSPAPANPSPARKEDRPAEKKAAAPKGDRPAGKAESSKGEGRR